MFIQGEWSRGRLHCYKCSARIGLFDFISGSKCSCQKYVLPGVQIGKSKVDYQAQAQVKLQVASMSTTRLPTPPNFLTIAEDLNSNICTETLSKTKLFSSNQCDETNSFLFYPSDGKENSADSLGNISNNTNQTSHSNIAKEPAAELLGSAESGLSTTGDSIRGRHRSPAQRAVVILQQQKANDMVAIQFRTSNRFEVLEEETSPDCKSGKPSDSSDESEFGVQMHVTCAVCWELYLHPMSVKPCGHVFCEPCLRRLSKHSHSSKVHCPLCRELVLFCYPNTGSC